MGTPKNSLQTKQLLIDVAGLLFAEHGYKQVTVRDIIDAAQANLGALNYHFGSKETLYGEVLKLACERDKIDLSVLENLSPSDKLVSVIRDSLEVYTLPAEERWWRMLIKRECQFPSHMFDTLVEDHFMRETCVVAKIIGEVVAEAADSEKVKMAIVTMVGLVDMYGLNRDLITAVIPELQGRVDDLESLAALIASCVINTANVVH